LSANFLEVAAQLCGFGAGLLPIGAHPGDYRLQLAKLLA
jgi:hypothetical protein